MNGIANVHLLSLLAVVLIFGGCSAQDLSRRGDRTFVNVNCLYCEPKTCNNVTGSCERCLMGFYGDKCEQTCPNTCSTCEKSNGRCSKCIDGWFGENCNFECVHCFSCNKESGACETCQPNYWGPQCQNECEYNCHVCRIDTGDCIHCAQGYFGENCARQCGHCRRGFCDQATGSCQFGCNDGFYGESCEKPCPQNCMVCNQTDGECLMCPAKMWGSQCDYTCPLNCDFCHVSTGECLECVEGFHGAKCEEPCGNCIGRVCVKDTGYVSMVVKMAGSAEHVTKSVFKTVPNATQRTNA
uniref:Scavenger receptor class F member 1-like n=1 Tax=Crassostrea virginica TaxID=6565 RepID=A0A8B8CNP5_CRAVI|nr:scavenger receptor class F member 1-like [Crassostrea virginica]